MATRYAHVISFGVNCQVASNIARLLGDGESLPFDWWNTPLFAVPLLLACDFAGLIERDRIAVSGDGRTVVHRDFGVFLHHDFPRDAQTDLVLPLTDSAIAQAREKYARRSDRLRSVLASDAPKLAVRYDSPDIDAWMRGYLADIWCDADRDSFVDAILARAHPGSCDILFLDSVECPVVAPRHGTTIACLYLPNDPAHAGWEGNIPGWDTSLRKSVVSMDQ